MRGDGMKIIDCEKKGNLLRLYLGNNDNEDYWGDDWNDVPYEHNAGTVYDEYVTGTVDFAFPFDACVFEPGDDWHYNGNSPYCKEDFKKGNIPFIVAVHPNESERFYGSYTDAAIRADSFKLFLNMPVDMEFRKMMKEFGCVCVQDEKRAEGKHI